ncbi:ABC transporter substrate-binding protein [Pseudoroseomonas wenyumeiae]|uniref:ABC transporter substrate-binding protein n=1 Tax=Teichococcus wenyumeiae TaxID=2478470 RepID=A0A3A9JHV0_9PROT|nr:ABC transporter substrate-binding protein [Pseudoroseomonas wenyumeiae]RKK05980.1 ABC transporter substrate-binding protein [Pseudoroseomonas wenyumeiae]RMI19798.1 ABC transporter substrate-binding protein [Pseudoroseomonas wenyumeiae]
MINRRQILALGGAALAAPRLARAAGGSVLRFVPHASPAVLDPTWNTAYVTRNHAYLVFDTLFGQDAAFRYQPQMLDGFETTDGGLRWTLRLREGQKFHDGTPVLARDCVASIRRWARRDDIGRALMAATDELLAASDRDIVFRLKRPYPLLPMALGKTCLMTAAMMPERLAAGDPDRPIAEMVGSGPFRFKPDEYVANSRLVYEKFADYRPRETGSAEGTAGPKHVALDRVEWVVMPDPSTASAALQSGEVDWWEQPHSDMLPLLRRSRRLRIGTLDPTGYIASLRVNHLQGPTANPAIRRLMLAAISQRDVVMAMAGTEPTLWRERVGFFCPGTELASEAGMSALEAPHDAAALAAAGYRGETLRLLVPGDLPLNQLASTVVADALDRAGFKVDVATMDFGSVLQRRMKQEPIDQGGWSAWLVLNAGTDQLNPGVHATLRGDGSLGNGWCRSPEIEAARDAWFAAPDATAQLDAARRLQEIAYTDVPYIPLGQTAMLTAMRSNFTGMIPGLPVFWGLRPA